MPDDALIRTFPPEVHTSLADLRRIAREAKSRDDPRLRKATDDEVSLALTLQRPWMCTGKSARTGLPCTKHRLLGASVCRVHGGSLKKTRIAATNRLREATLPVLGNLIATALQTDNLIASVKAADSVLDRAGIGEVVQAKIRSSKHHADGKKIVVQLGFLSCLSKDGAAPLTIEVPKPDDDEA